MTSQPQTFFEVLNSDDIQYILNLPQVLEAQQRLTESSRVERFNIPLTPSLRESLQTRLGLDLSSVESIPLRWAHGDTAPHIDNSASAFDKTYLVYLTDSPGELIVGSNTYSITQNTGYSFLEGLRHETLHTAMTSRLMIGPMSERAEPVGFAGIQYYVTESDALNYTNVLSNSGYAEYTLTSVSGYTTWRIASNSSGTSPQNVTYVAGNTLNADGNSAYYYVYATNLVCFLEGTTILTVHSDGRAEEYVPIENLKQEMLIQTIKDGPKRLAHLGRSKVYNPGNAQRSVNRLYVCKRGEFEGATEDLIVTGQHALLVDSLTDTQRVGCQCLGKQEEFFKKEGKYRVPAYVCEKTEPYQKEGVHTIYHLALEDIDPNASYGILANGVAVESCSTDFLTKSSGHELLF